MEFRASSKACAVQWSYTLAMEAVTCFKILELRPVALHRLGRHSFYH